MLEDELMQKFMAELPVLPEGWFYDFFFEKVFDFEAKGWKYNITATAIKQRIIMKINTKRYFVSGHYSVAGRPKMEDELMRRAVTYYLRTIVTDRDKMADFVMSLQDQLSAQNPRWKKVRIYYYDGVEGTSFFHIGEQHLTLQEIRENVEDISNPFN